MPKLCKRIIALLLAFCLVCSLCFSAFAVTSENQATFWDAALAHLAGSNDFYGWNLLDGCGIFDYLGSIVSHDTVCAQSSDGYHHGTQIDSLVDGRAKVLCTECGQWFYYSADDLQQDYQTYLHDSNLDNGLQLQPDGRIKWHIPISAYFAIKFFGMNSEQNQSTGHALNYPAFSSYSISTYSISNSSPLRIDSRTIQLKYDIRFYTPNRVNYYVDFPSQKVLSCSYGDIYIRSSVGTNAYNAYGMPQPESPLSVDIPRPDSSSSTVPFNVTFYSPYCYLRPVDSSTLPTVPQNITINNITYPVVDIDFNSRTVHVEGDTKIEYGDTEIKIYEGDTVIQTINYIIENDDPGTDPGSGDDSSTPTDPGNVDPGDASGSGGSGCCEQCALLLRQVNSYLLQIQTLVDQINDKLGPESDNYMEGIYNLLVEINTALDNLPTEPHKDYEAKLTTISNQLANIWGDLDTIKTSLSAVQTNTATTNQKLDTVHADLQAVLSELQTQRGILSQILSVLRDILSHVVTIDKNVDELSTEEQQQDFIHGFIGKFSFINQIYQITVQMMRDVTNDAISAQAVSDGIIPSSVLSAGHASLEDGEDSSADSSIDNRAFAGLSRSGLSRSGPSNPTAPEVMTQFPDVDVLGFNLSQYSALDMSWYAPYKSEVDVILSGFMYLGYLWLLFKRLPSIIRGGAMASSDYDKVQTEFYGKKGD